VNGVDEEDDNDRENETKKNGLSKRVQRIFHWNLYR
jgi:hypothetical protein